MNNLAKLYKYVGNSTIGYYQNKIQKELEKKVGNLKPSRNYNFDHSIAAEAIDAINKVNEKYNLEIFLVDGGLLGLVREGTLLAHDYDLDMGFVLSKYPVLKLKEIFELEEDFSYISSSDDTVFISYKDIQIDLFGFKDIEYDKMCISTDIHTWVHDKFSLKKVDFLNTKVLIPDPPENYLINNYGDWQQKKIAYDFSYDTPNRVYNGLTGLIYLVCRLENAIKNGWDSYASMAVSALYKNYNIDYRHIFPMPCVAHPVDSLKEESILIVLNNVDNFNLDLLNMLKSNYDSTKNLLVSLVGDNQNKENIKKIIAQLSFVTQVFSFNEINLNQIKKLYPNIEVVNND